MKPKAGTSMAILAVKAGLCVGDVREAPAATWRLISARRGFRAAMPPDYTTVPTSMIGGSR
jgi:hypothetical protein